MPRLDEWVTDRAVRFDQVRSFVNQPELVGVTIVSADEPPEQSAGGKFRQVVPLAISEQA